MGFFWRFYGVEDSYWWIFSIDNYFRVKNIVEDGEKMKIAAMEMRDCALKWWLWRIQPHPSMSWNTFKEIFFYYFKPKWKSSFLKLDETTATQHPDMCDSLPNPHDDCDFTIGNNSNSCKPMVYDTTTHPLYSSHSNFKNLVLAPTVSLPKKKIVKSFSIHPPLTTVSNKPPLLSPPLKPPDIASSYSPQLKPPNVSPKPPDSRFSKTIPVSTADMMSSNLEEKSETKSQLLHFGEQIDLLSQDPYVSKPLNSSTLLNPHQIPKKIDYTSPIVMPAFSTMTIHCPYFSWPLFSSSTNAFSSFLSFVHVHHLPSIYLLPPTKFHQHYSKAWGCTDNENLERVKKSSILLGADSDNLIDDWLLIDTSPFDPGLFVSRSPITITKKTKDWKEWESKGGVAELKGELKMKFKIFDCEVPYLYIVPWISARVTIKSRFQSIDLRENILNMLATLPLHFWVPLHHPHHIDAIFPHKTTSKSPQHSFKKVKDDLVVEVMVMMLYKGKALDILRSHSLVSVSSSMNLDEIINKSLSIKDEQSHCEYHFGLIQQWLGNFQRSDSTCGTVPKLNRSEVVTFVFLFLPHTITSSSTFLHITTDIVFRNRISALYVVTSILSEWQPLSSIPELWDEINRLQIRPDSSSIAVFADADNVDDFENMATLSPAANLVSYFAGIMHYELSNYAGVSYMFSIVVAVLADTFIGRYKSVVLSGNIKCLGLALLAIQAGTGNVLKVQNLLGHCSQHLNKGEIHQGPVVLGIAMVAMAEELGVEMVIRSLEHLLQYGEQNIRRVVPLALGLLCISNPKVSVMDTLSRLSHDTDSEVAMADVISFGLIGAGTNNARIAGMQRNLSRYYYKEVSSPLLDAHYPSQAVVSDIVARRTAEVVGLEDYGHLEAGRIYHAARLVAILEAYALYDPEIGYCQGMSDLLSPIMSIISEDHEAFWYYAIAALVLQRRKLIIEKYNNKDEIIRKCNVNWTSLSSKCETFLLLVYNLEDKVGFKGYSLERLLDSMESSWSGEKKISSDLKRHNK